MKAVGYAFFTVVVLSALLVAACFGPNEKAATGSVGSRPNIVIILADDLGFSDLGAFGSEIRTPNIDQLARNGLMLTNYHAGPVCAVSRSMLLTGLDHHKTGFGSSRGGVRRVPALGELANYSGELDSKVETLATQLQKHGYKTLMAGKWDLGSTDASLPHRRGFDRSFVLVESGASHFADATRMLPYYKDPTYLEDGVAVKVLPPGFYSSEFYTSKIIDYIKNTDTPEQPFFAYLSFTAPHWPLQVPDDWLHRYKDQYKEGWLPVATNRLNRMRQSGLFAEPLPTGQNYRHWQAEWAALTPEAKQQQTRTMQLYAAMIEYLDVQVGRLLAYLADSGQLDNTIILFTSDNGPEGNNVGGIGTTAAWVQANFDNRLNNMGRPNSYLWPGEHWGRVAATPFLHYKSLVSEGGLRVPAILHLPAGLRGISDEYISVKDIMPTLLGFAGAGNAATKPLDGRRLTAWLQGRVNTVPPTVAGWELFGNRALYQGHWKAMLLWPPFGTGHWQLYNLQQDREESRDLSGEHTEQLNAMVAQWQQFARAAAVVVIDKDYGYGRPEPEADSQNSAN